MTKAELERKLDAQKTTIQNLTRMNGILRQLVLSLSKQKPTVAEDPDPEIRLH